MWKHGQRHTKALGCALEKHSIFNTKARTIIVELNKIFLNNVVTIHGNQLYVKKGIGDNHSVTLTNITLHYTLQLNVSPSQHSWPDRWSRIPRCSSLHTEDDFGFVTKDFVKPTAEVNKFINGKSQHPYTTFKPILFGEALRRRRPNRSGEDYLTSLNRL